jgi:glycosyltransferase involved in cell wall biosynthesis
VPITLKFLVGQVGYMKRRGFDVLAVSSPGGYAERFRANEGVEVHEINMPRRITPFRDLVALIRMYRYLRRVRPQIVHAHTPKGGLLGTIAAWLARVPVRIYHIHGLPFVTATGARRVLLRFTEKISCALAHQVLCVSASVREVAVRGDLCSSRKITVLGNGSINGVDAARFDPGSLIGAGAAVRNAHAIPDNALVIGFVGRVVRDKGIIELTESWQQLRGQFSNLHLLIVGPFEQDDPLPDAINAVLHEDERVHLAGVQDEPAAFYAAVDVLALPTYREGFGLVALEAAAMGLPAVATRIPGCIDAVENGVTGTLVPARDVPALTEAIRSYLLEPELRRRHGGAGRERARRDFAQQNVWDALYCEYVRLLDGSRLPPPQPVRVHDRLPRRA